jgi:hypothetical protein
MAVGILGVGLTMVASVFPVAVDQSRRGKDSTMAALCARSVAATLRARRQRVVGEVRDFFNKMASDNDAISRDRPAEYDGLALSTAPAANKLPLTATPIITKDMREYNPQSFLYEQGRIYDFTSKPTSGTNTNPFWPFWNAGNYIPIIYVTPLVNGLVSGVPTRNTAENRTGPWRVTIVVFKSRATYADPAMNKTWYQDAQSRTVGAGGFVIDRSKNAGEAYLIDSVSVPSGNQFSQATVYLSVPKTADGYPNLTGEKIGSPAPTMTNTAASIWYVQPGAVAAFHTVIGD